MFARHPLRVWKAISREYASFLANVTASIHTPDAVSSSQVGSVADTTSTPLAFRSRINALPLTLSRENREKSCTKMTDTSGRFRASSNIRWNSTRFSSNRNALAASLNSPTISRPFRSAKVPISRNCCGSDSPRSSCMSVETRAQANAFRVEPTGSPLPPCALALSDDSPVSA
ncbi:MAG: hypothetical protein GW867_05155 [Armatimonadetes bacterium]|nr:hypothetical protein [Armatimonadota bacterium]